MNTPLTYLSHYGPAIQQQVNALLAEKKLKDYLLKLFPTPHNITNDKALREYVMAHKNHFLKKSAPLSKIIFDDKIHAVNNALGLHSYISRVQGNKLKSKNEIRIASVFKKAPLALLEMIVVHELAHLKEKEHNKAFYQLCEYMQPNYHQLELMMRIYLTEIELNGHIYH